MLSNLGSFNHKDFLNRLINGDHATCSSLAKDYTKRNSIQDFYENVVKKALYDIGELWEHNKISVATEHLSSAIVEAILNELYAQIVAKEKVDKTVIVACVENEFHQIGIKMISDIFEMQGWNTHFLGSNTPTQELIAYTKTINPDMLAISLSIYFHLPVFENLIQMLRNEFPFLPILVGGQAFRHGGLELLKKYKNVTYQPDLLGAESYIRSIR
jgi:MerR family transcriptional regulator, light-induced transcriptional regulator